ncbi:MAG: twin-arginine translocase TatA/TatE family subunit [Myxococcales bacterium]|nr:twin-arginine translocase TatA/TatE family subunit [Myxococcales bacterium]
MPNLGLSELIVIFLLLLVVFGASRLPALGEGLGRTIRSFKRGFASDDSIEVSEAEPKPPAEASEPEASAQGGASKPPAARASSTPVRAIGDDVEDAELVEPKS